MGKGSMAFGNLGAKMSELAVSAPAEAPPVLQEEKKESSGETAGWSWSALAAMDGVVSSINPNIYGEVLTDGCALMFKGLPDCCRLEPDSVVYDFGSGYGKFSIWVGTVAKHKSVGIEYNESRGKAAEKALKLCFEKGFLEEEDKTRIDLRTGDGFIDGAFGDATHMYVCNVGFGDDMHTKILKQIPKCSNFRVLMTITALHEGEKAAPRADYEAAGLTYGGCSVCPTTWDPQGEMTKCHFYMTKLGAQARETPPLKLKLADAERYSKLVDDVYELIMKDIPTDKI